VAFLLTAAVCQQWLFRLLDFSLNHLSLFAFHGCSAPFGARNWWNILGPPRFLTEGLKR